MSQLYKEGKTIAALATAPGEGGVAIIRISGQEALEVGNRLFSGNVFSYQSHTVHFGAVLDAKGEKIDQALLIVMKGPRSYTGEDTVEIQCHGGSQAAKAVLQRALEAGALPAEPGEFTFKAFMNGKIDLSQAEAVQKVVGARSLSAFKQASNHLEGALSKKIRQFQKELSALAGILEAWVDFPEEGLEFASQESLLATFAQVEGEMQTLLDTFEEGKKLEEGVALCLVGAPNVGKSSLMNALLKKERAIVTPIAGTTRDTLEETFLLEGHAFHILDTAGIRETSEMIEKEGIERAKKAIKSADIVLCVLDASKEISRYEQAFLKTLDAQNTLFVWNKKDLMTNKEPPIRFENQVLLSAKKEEGLETLKKALLERVTNKTKGFAKEEVLLSSLRHKEALATSIKHLKQAHEAFAQSESPEYLVFDVRQALKGLGKIIGTDITEDILTEIFSKFCIGK